MPPLVAHCRSFCVIHIIINKSEEILIIMIDPK